MRSRDRDKIAATIIGTVLLGGAVSDANASSVIWDSIDTHEWIPESFGGNPIAGSGWVDFQDRRCFQVLVGPGPQGYAVVRTKRFLLEDWDDFTSLQADIYVVGANGTHLKLEPRGAAFDPAICPIHSPVIPADQWHTVSFPFPAGCDLSALGMRKLCRRQGQQSKAEHRDGVVCSPHGADQDHGDDVSSARPTANP